MQEKANICLVHELPSDVQIEFDSTDIENLSVFPLSQKENLSLPNSGDNGCYGSTVWHPAWWLRGHDLNFGLPIAPMETFNFALDAAAGGHI